MQLPDDWDWKRPDYATIYRRRIEALKRIRDRPADLPALKAHYRAHPADFIDDWGVTVDPRLVDRGLPALIPFVLFPRQREFVEFIVRKWLAHERGMCEKSRDMGVTWLTVGCACALCLHHEGMAFGFGSRKEEYVDKIGQPKAILPKARVFMANLPVELRGGWRADRDAPFMRINFPETGSTIGGEAGDQIGRGDRTSAYVVDEHAYIERAENIESSLSQTTNCRIDVSSVNGMNNVFARNRHEGKIEVFVFDWRDDPRKDQAWYDKQCAEYDPVVVAQEIDRDYSASVEGIVIPGAWARSAINALEKLGIAPTGRRSVSLDVADEGKDKNAACRRLGVEVQLVEEWSGKGSDTFATAERAFTICDEHESEALRYDADGLGAFVRGDGRVINERRVSQGRKPILLEAFRGSDGVWKPEAEDVKGRKNKDYFQNRKAQAWWSLRERFRRTHRWVTQSIACAPDDIISIKPVGPYLKLVTELSQPTYSLNGAGKVVVDKAPENLKSPNLADSVMMDFATIESTFKITSGLVAEVLRSGRLSRRP